MRGCKCPLHRAPVPRPREVEFHTVYAEQFLVLFEHCVVRFGQNLDKIVLGEVVEFHSNRESALKLGNKVFHTRDMERARRDKEYKVSAD